MYEIFKQDKFLLISNGDGVIHHVHNETNSVTTTGQPFMLIGDTEEYVNDLFYSEWSKDEEGVLTGTAFPIDWIVGHDSEAEALVIIDAIMSVASFIKFRPIKHPDREEWANPVQMKVVEEIPDGEVKTTLVQILGATTDQKTNNEMKSDGWF